MIRTLRAALAGALAFVIVALAPALALAQIQAPIGRLIGANFNSTADQAIAITGTPRYNIRSILVTNCSVSMTTAIGGFYDTASKGGTPIVAATQAYSALTTAANYLNTTMNSTLLIRSSPVVYLSLTTAQGSAATCDVYVYGQAIY
jgi:hypothetical protein